MEKWDLVIVGAGAAGLTAGIYGARSGLRTLILEEKVAGGETALSPLIENYPGFLSISGKELADRMVEHCKKFGVQINEFEGVTEMNLTAENKTIKTNRAIYSTSAVIIATGTHYRELKVPGEKEFFGRGVSFCVV